ncbi:hypothetical protein SARC_16723, partial [Sphaeroforma arctica JP610]
MGHGTLGVLFIGGIRYFLERADYMVVWYHNTRRYEKARSGVPPADLETITSPELKDFISKCLNGKDDRPTAKELLCHSFLFE